MHIASKHNNWHYNVELKMLARKLRKDMTKAEVCLWKYVLQGREKYKFLRQRPVLNYIADFMCKELLLIIEVDGYTHTFEETIVSDKVREDNLKNVGFTVVRFLDREILNDIENVRFEIDAWIEKLSVK